MSDEIEIPGELPFPADARDLPAPAVLSGAPLSTDTVDGWCPFATRHATPNFWPGHTDRSAAVDHTTEAGWASVVSWFKNPASQRSAHFQVRQDGTIDQFVSTEDSAWANGASWNGQAWIDPQGHVIRPPWPAMASNRTNPNRRTISKEHEGNTRTPWTAAQREADTKLNRWLATQYPSLAPYVAGHTLIRHGDISPVTKPNCPGSLVNLIERAAAANGATPTPPPPPPKPPKPDWVALWGPIALPDATSWQWSIPTLWKTHHLRLRQCVAPALYGDDGAVVQMFEGGDVRGRSVGDKQIYEVCFR